MERVGRQVDGGSTILAGELVVVQNFQHYQKRTQSILFCGPLPPLPKEYFEKVDF